MEKRIYRPEITYRMARSDYSYMSKNYGDVDEFCGDFCNTDNYIKLLENPCEETARLHYIDLLEYYFSSTTCIKCPHSSDRIRLEISDNDNRANRIKKRYTR